jgi:hypothetical protein
MAQHDSIKAFIAVFIIIMILLLTMNAFIVTHFNAHAVTSLYSRFHIMMMLALILKAFMPMKIRNFGSAFY